VIQLYSRRFYSSTRAKNTPVIQTITPKKAPVATEEIRASDTRPRRPLDFFGDEFSNEEKFYAEPRNFSPASDITDGESVVTLASEMPHPTEDEKVRIVSAADENIGEKMKNMTFEDMMLTWLAMLGSSGEYDDEIFIILGLILMIGA
jgi:hypothetical protein